MALMGITKSIFFFFTKDYIIKSVCITTKLIVHDWLKYIVLNVIRKQSYRMGFFF